MAWKHSSINLSVATGMCLFFSYNMVMLLLSLIFLQLSSPTTTQAFHLLAYGEADYGYVIGSPNGPDRWGDLRSEWVTCKTGNQQSPINLVKREAERAPSLGMVATNYRDAVSKLRNDGHTVKLEWSEDAGSVLFNSVSYRLLQVHLHSASEHTINDHSFPLELHMVHRSTNNRTAVLGVLYQYGTPDDFLAQLESGIRKITKMEGAEIGVGSKDPNHVGLRHLSSYYRYTGSLTTPPCTEGVFWTVFDKVKTVSRAQVKLLKEAVNDEAFNNARPTQPTNGRTVLYYPPTDHL